MFDKCKAYALNILRAKSCYLHLIFSYAIKPTIPIKEKLLFLFLSLLVFNII